MLSKRTNGNNNYAPLPPALLEYVPVALQEKISTALDQEGIMTEPAQDRILRAIAEDRKVLQGMIAENHKESLASIDGLKETLHLQDKRLTLVESDVTLLKKAAADIDTLKRAADDVTDLKTAAKDAADDRRDTKRLVKGWGIGTAGLLVVTAVMGYYNLKGPTHVSTQPEPTQQSSSSDIKDLIKEIRQDREDRKADAPVTVQPKAKSRTKPKGPGAQMREGEMLTTREPSIPTMAYNYIDIKGFK